MMNMRNEEVRFIENYIPFLQAGLERQPALVQVHAGINQEEPVFPFDQV